MDFSHTWKSVEPSLKYTENPKFGVPPEKPNLYLRTLGEPLVESFNFLFHGGLRKAANDMLPVEFELKNGQRIRLKINGISIQKPEVSESLTPAPKNSAVYPKECRLRHTTYKGKLMVKVGWAINNKVQIPFERSLGEIPIMVGSEHCNLGGLSPKEIVEKGEHEQEWGGYFIIKGHERLLRMLSATRKNYPIAVQRDIWKGRGKLFTDKGVYLRSVKEDFTSTNNVLHYLSNGTMKLMFSFRKAIYVFPIVLILKALIDCPDSYIYEQLTQGIGEDLYYKDRISFMLRQLQQEGLYSRTQVRNYIGRNFRLKMHELPSWYTDEEVCQVLLNNSVAIHLSDDVDKFHLLVFMTRKLFAFAQGKCAQEGMDPVMMQEVTLAGHVYLQLLKDRLSVWLNVLKLVILKRQRAVKNFVFNQSEMGSLLGRCGKMDASFENVFATGNLPSSADLGLQQTSGLSIIAENINRMRYMSHFRAIHRGASFMTSRSSEVRQLKPDAWGFLCPVHTPDGSPCGLLNHLTSTCHVVNKAPDTSKLPELFAELGMTPVSETKIDNDFSTCFVVMLEGRIVGRVSDKCASRFVDKLRMLKVRGEKVPNTLEIAFVPRTRNGQYPGIFIFAAPARMMRPVYNIAAGAVELVGTFEQVYLNICITDEEHHEGITTHRELSETSFLSNLASLIPLPDFNQSPRNMYQCQMGKQTMGTPVHNWRLQSNSKLYRLQTPTTPFLRPGHWDRINMDDFAMGTNAIVAVISYTGYDMEDAMVINRGSLQRGFAHGQVYKPEIIDLKDVEKSAAQVRYFQRNPSEPALQQFLDADGLPYPGTYLQENDPYYCYFELETGKYVVKRYKGHESMYVDNVFLIGSDWQPGMNKATICFRIPRNPQIGDKFASRAGQKGICSQQWLTEDLPFTESGLVPDIVFNPHGFPSRMTIAMMIECMAGKSAAVHGIVHDATPFRFSEEHTAIDYHGKLLEEAGYNYYGTEKLYSGVDGREMEADIFFGIVHYQRLRHMVSDKFQVRSVGAVDHVTSQPVKGRKRGGGVRFGEMERDGLVSHGALYLLYDRLFNCSDQSTVRSIIFIYNTFFFFLV